MHILNSRYYNLNKFGEANLNRYIQGTPFPHIVIERLFNSSLLSEVSEEFPDLSNGKPFKKKINYQVGKFYTGNETNFGFKTLRLFHYLNSQPWLDFLQTISGIEEKLFGDPYYWGGGLHQTKNGGWLKIHSDFKKHPDSNLDRRINVIIFLNKEWEKSFGGSLELWDKKMKKCVQSIPPIFNNTVIFNTTDYSNHGYPDPIHCPENISRKSIALYYYTNGRPENEINYKVRQKDDKTYWKPRKNNKLDNVDFNQKFSLYNLIVELIRKVTHQMIFRVLFRKHKRY